MEHHLGVLLDTDRACLFDVARFIYGHLAYKDHSTIEKNLVSASGIRVEAKIFTDAAYVTFYTGSARRDVRNVKGRVIGDREETPYFI